MLKTKEEIKKEIKEAVLSCPYNKKQDKEHRCSDCRTETDILEALLKYSEEIIEEIQSRINTTYINRSIHEVLMELKQSISGETK